MVEPSAEVANLGALRNVPFMGAIFVVHEAMKLGHPNGHPRVRDRQPVQPDRRGRARRRTRGDRGARGVGDRPSPDRQWMRFSLGPPEDNMVQSLDRLQRMLECG